MRPRVPRPGIPTLRDADIRFAHEDDIPTSTGPRSTKRPPSIADTESDDTSLGKVMASQARIVEAFGIISAREEVRRREHETAMRELSTLGKAIEEMGFAQRGTSRTLRNASRFVPAALVLIEVAKQVFSHYFGGT